MQTRPDDTLVSTHLVFGQSSLACHSRLMPSISACRSSGGTRRCGHGVGLRVRVQGIIRGKPVQTTVADTAAPCPLDRVNR